MVGSFVLGMNAATAAGARTLYGMSRSGMTIRWFSHINRHNVPNRGMYVDVCVNILAVRFLPTTVAVLAARNMGVRPVPHRRALRGAAPPQGPAGRGAAAAALSPPWLWLTGLLVAVNVSLLLVGATAFSITGYGRWPEVFVGLALLAVGCLAVAAPSAPDGSPAQRVLCGDGLRQRRHRRSPRRGGRRTADAR